MAMSVPYLYYGQHWVSSKSLLLVQNFFKGLFQCSNSHFLATHSYLYFLDFFWHYQFIILFSLSIRLVFLCWFCCSVVSDSLRSHGLQPARLLCPWNFPGRNTRVGFCFQLQWIFLTHVLNPCLLCLMPWQVDSLPLAPPGKPLCWL